MQNMELNSNPGSQKFQDLKVREPMKAPKPPPRILVVEDDEVTLEAICRQIHRYDSDIEILPAHSMLEAQRYIEASPPDLLITDFYLDRESTALDLLRLVEKHKKPSFDCMVISTGAPLPALFAAEREGLRIKFVKKPVDRFLLYRFLQFDLDRGYYL